MKMNQWHYDESKHCGIDYSKAKQAEIYDEQHQFLGLQDPENKVIIDLGCGTGATSIYAADVFKAVFAVDVSEVMLEKAKRKLTREVPHLKFVKAGFLSYEHAGDPVDLVITKAAFHHLPDFWKQIALMRINRMLKMDGLLYIHDVVFQFEPQKYVSQVNSWISRFEKVGGEELKHRVETHIRDEYSTFGWVLKGMLERAGFAIEKCKSEDDFMTEYACRKVKELKCEE